MSKSFEERYRKQVEQCDKEPVIVIHAAVGGGSGSGLMTHLLHNEELSKSKAMKLGNILFGNIFHSTGSTVEPYNTILAIPTLTDQFTAAILHNNQGLSKIYRQIYGLKERPTLKDLNSLQT